jgi:hypothetical protein
MKSERQITGETRRGGCLDYFVQLLTFGKLGVESTILYDQNSNPTHLILRQYPFDQASDSRRAVHNMPNLKEEEQITRKVVKNFPRK